MSNRDGEQSSRAACRLVAYWLSIGSRIKPGASEHDLQAFEKRHSVCLPEDFREYLMLCDGLRSEDSGHFGGDGNDWRTVIEFWPLKRISAERDGVSGEYFGFADFLIDSHWYVICLSADVHLSGAVGVGDENGIDRQIGDSFSDFVEVYLRDPEGVSDP